MSRLPSSVHITEEGPREGFQIEKGPIPTARKIELIDALSQTGLDAIQIVSFVNPKLVRGITPRPGVRYTGLWLNERGFERALATKRLHLEGSVVLSASESFLVRNQNRRHADQVAEQHTMLELYKRHGVAVDSGLLMAAFGCNFEGDIP